ncbi:site-2 protease family protein [Trichothermofontia sichuanensis B231]|uniref:site-2 protease family protein n=1 Tax=Trichothermofontia sichuanensis TaxID=3045816 RepID=UPI002245C336|nr:site-2 protease family protein [Trichothermofontia sichuanensis]UZQ55760.1 site-2 protease family protein [Trichothermofontia sichuanensis B231]
MTAASETVTTVLISLVAIAILGWGFFRARPYGKLGILAWLQSVVLMVPWLLFFGLFALGIYLNLAAILLLLVSSTVIYIFLGRQLRAAGQDAIAQKKAARLAQRTPSPDSHEVATTEPPATDAEETAAPDRPVVSGEITPSSAPVSSPPLGILPIPAEDLKQIQTIFGIDTFFATETIPYQDGAIFRGNLRTDPEAAYSRLAAKLDTILGDRYRLFLVENSDGRPVVIVLPSANDPQPLTWTQRGLAVLLLVATVFTCLERGSLQYGIDLVAKPSAILPSLPISLGVVAVLVAHELGHWLLARRYQVRLSWPFFIPAWQLGTFGAITRIESLLPNRSVLFDIVFAGPAAGGLVALGLLLVGLLLPPTSAGITVPSQFFEGSMLVGALARIVLGEGLREQLVTVHPLAIAGWLGLVITALNLMPAGQLDGGRLIQAIYGRKTLSRTTVATLIFLAIACLVNPIALYWAIIILFLQRQPERPSLNELTEPNDTRASLALLALFLMAATLLPLTPSLAGRLGIGG